MMDAEAASEPKQIIIAPQVFVSLAPGLGEVDAYGEWPCHADIGVAWSWDKASFRMDVTVPLAGALNIIFPFKAEIIYVNGEIVWDSKGFHKTAIGKTTVEPISDGLRMNFAAGGPYHILARGLTVSESH
jgi:hypothetical protein